VLHCAGSALLVLKLLRGATAAGSQCYFGCGCMRSFAAICCTCMLVLLSKVSHLTSGAGVLYSKPQPGICLLCCCAGAGVSQVLMLVTNSLKMDLNNHRNQFIVGLALAALGNICSAGARHIVCNDMGCGWATGNAWQRVCARAGGGGGATSVEWHMVRALSWVFLLTIQQRRSGSSHVVCSRRVCTSVTASSRSQSAGCATLCHVPPVFDLTCDGCGQHWCCC
jgi:hypothetical protein